MHSTFELYGELNSLLSPSYFVTFVGSKVGSKIGSKIVTFLPTNKRSSRSGSSACKIASWKSNRTVTTDLSTSVNELPLKIDCSQFPNFL